MAYNVAIFKANEVIHHFDDKASFTSEIDPGALYWRWTMKPMPKEPEVKHHRKGRKANVPAQYQIVVRAMKMLQWH